MVFAIDGIDESSYAKYRIGGDVRRALHNMRAYTEALARFGTRERVRLAWQYLLFDWNDSDDELARAKALAAEIGIPIRWTLTHTEGRSKRFSAGSPAMEKLIEGGETEAASCGVKLHEFLADGGIPGSRTVGVACKLSSLPYATRWWSRAGYRAHFRADETFLTGPAGSTVALKISVENKTNQSWRVGGKNNLRFRHFAKECCRGNNLRNGRGYLARRSSASKGTR